MSNPSDRRRSPRVELVGQVRGEVATLAVAIKVREISLGGMSIETGSSLAVGATHQFILTLGDGAAVDVLGRVVYCRRAPGNSGTPLFISGLQFVDEDAPDSPPHVSEFVKKIK